MQGAFQLLTFDHLDHLDHLAETSSQALSNIKFDKVTVWDSGNGNGGTAGFLQSLGRSLPPILDVMRNLGGVQLPDFFGKLVEEEQEDGARVGSGQTELTAKETGSTVKHT